MWLYCNDFLMRIVVVIKIKRFVLRAKDSQLNVLVVTLFWMFICVSLIKEKKGRGKRNINMSNHLRETLNFQR